MISQVPSSLGPGPGSRPEGPGEARQPCKLWMGYTTGKWRQEVLQPGL